MQDRSEQKRVTTGVRSARRALEILSLMRETRSVLTTKEVVEETGLPRTTVLRLLDTLRDAGLLWATEPNGFVPGPALLRWTALASRTWDLPPGAREAMGSLAESSGETVSLYVRHELQRVCIASAEGTRALRHVARIGSQQPMWVGAPARVLLLQTPTAVIKRIARACPRGSEHADVMLGWKADVERDGWAITHGEREDGLSVVGVPVRDPDGYVVASLSLAGPTPRFGDDLVPRFRDRLVELASQLEEASYASGPGWFPKVV